MPVDRCVCLGLPFTVLKARAALPGGGQLTFEALSAATGCSTMCALCKPYVQLMLKTGRTTFEPWEGVQADSAKPKGESG